MTLSPKVWGDALRRLQNELPDFAFKAWIAPLQVKLAKNRIVLGGPSSFHCDRVRMHHAEAIGEIVRDLTGVRPTIEILSLSEFAAAEGSRYEILGSVETPSSAETCEQEDVLRAELREPLRVAAAEQGQAQVRALSGSGTGTGSPVFNVPGPTSGTAAQSPKNLQVVPAKARQVSAKQPARAEESKMRGGPVSGTSGPNLRSSSQSAETPSDRRGQKGDLALSLDGTPTQTTSTPTQGELPFSFESFVIGPCNSLAREAALALARQRQPSLNQIYLGGEAGMGKTHLARATAIEAKRHSNLGSAFSARTLGQDRTPGGSNRPGIVYTTAEQFTSEFVSAMRHGRSDEFKKRYRGPIGLLIVEDVQSFQGRAKTQLELFNTIEHVLDAGGRVMLTGDRSPRDLGALDPRMREQLGRGFVAELEAPDALVRRHLLRTKAAAGGVHLPEDCLDLLVESTAGSVRDIESVLIQVVATSSLLGRTIDLDLTQEAVAMKSGAGSSLAPKTIAVSEIVRIVAAFFGKRPEALASRSRRRDVLIPRQLAMYLAHRYTDASFTEIGKGLNRDHPAVRNAIQRVERLVLENAPLRYQVEALSERIDQTLKNQAENG